MTKYYYAGTRRVAMRTNDGTLYFMLSDPLGSTSVTTTSTGTLYSEIRYNPWGEIRVPADKHNPGPSNYTFTLLVTAGGAFLVVTGLAETSTVLGAFLGLHQIPVGVFVGASGLLITAVGGYLIYDSFARP